MEFKILLFYFSQIVGYGTFLWAMASSLETFQKLVLWVLAVGFGVVKFKSAWLDYQKKKFDLDQHKYDKMEERKRKSMSSK